MSFMGSCSGLHSAKKAEKAKLNEMNMTQNVNTTQAQTQINNNTSNTMNCSKSSSYSIFTASLFKTWSNPQSAINNTQQIQNNSSPQISNWFNSSNAIISSRFQQQTKHH